MKLKLDLACGMNPTPGFEGVDISPCHPDVKHVLDLLSFPWPWADGSVSELRCSHFVEHIPAGFWTPRRSAPAEGSGVKTSIGAETKSASGTLSAFQQDHRSLDLLMKFMDEAYRVLEPGGTFVVECPQAHNNRAFQDPTHRRYLVQETFFYFSAAWRKQTGLEHGPYGISCDFTFKVDHTFPEVPSKEVEMLMRSPAGRTILAARNNERWNVTEDLRVTLVKVSNATQNDRGTQVAPAAVLSDLDARIEEANARAAAEEAIHARERDIARRDHEVQPTGETPHLFKVSRLPGGVKIEQGNMRLPGDKTWDPEIRAFPDPMPEEMSGAPTAIDKALLGGAS